MEKQQQIVIKKQKLSLSELVAKGISIMNQRDEEKKNLTTRKRLYNYYNKVALIAFDGYYGDWIANCQLNEIEKFALSLTNLTNNYEYVLNILYNFKCCYPFVRKSILNKVKKDKFILAKDTYFTIPSPVQGIGLDDYDIYNNPVFEFSEEVERDKELYCEFVNPYNYNNGNYTLKKSIIEGLSKYTNFKMHVIDRKPTSYEEFNCIDKGIKYVNNKPNTIKIIPINQDLLEIVFNDNFKEDSKKLQILNNNVNGQVDDDW